jgi:hypothetical protein
VLAARLVRRRWTSCKRLAAIDLVITDVVMPGASG